MLDNNSNSSDFHWVLRQEQLEALICRGYSEIFTTVCEENRAMEFADDARQEYRWNLIRSVVEKILEQEELEWPPEIFPKVRLYTVDQFRDTGILLGRDEIIFSWPGRSGSEPNQNGKRTTSIQDQRCLESSNVKRLVDTDFTPAKYLSGKVVADALAIFEETIFLSLQHPTIARTLLENLDETKSLYRKSYVQRYSRQLPRNLIIEFAKDESKYIIKCNKTNSDDKTLWTLVLPMMLEESGNELASPPLRFYPSVDGCDPPCKEAETKS